MAKHSVVTKVADGVTNQFSISFTGGYISRSDVTARVGIEADGTGQPLYRTITWISDGVVTIGGTIPEKGTIVTFQRTTPITNAINDFSDGTVLSAASLDIGFAQCIKRLQEVADAIGNVKDTDGVLAAVTTAANEAKAYRDTTQNLMDATSKLIAANVVRQPLTPTAKSVVSRVDYSAFPSLQGNGNQLVVAYHRGRNHGRSDAEGVCLPQSVATAGDLVLNGNEAANNAVVLGAPTEVTIQSVGNNGGVGFTIYGSYKGVEKVVVVAGPVSNTVTTTDRFDAITRITTSAATVGNVSIGLIRIASNIEVRVSNNGGASWSAAVAVGDGLTTKQYRCYYPALGRSLTGVYTLVYMKEDIDTKTVRHIVRTSVDGVTWTPERDMVITGEASPIYAFFGKMSCTPAGRLLVGAYLGAKQFVLYSDDNGVTWKAVLQYTEAGFTTSEVSFVVLDERTWLSWLRKDNQAGTLVQLRTTDGGDTWTDLGEIGPMPVSGGYKSHDSTIVTVDGVQYVFLTIMSRAASVSGTNPKTIIAKWCRVDDARVRSSSYFSGEAVLVDDLVDMPRNGYPSLYVDPVTSAGFLVYHTETTDRRAEVLGKAINVTQVIQGSDEWVDHAFTIVGSTSGTQALNMAQGRWRRRGDQVTVIGRCRADGAVGVVGSLQIGNLPYMADAPVPHIGSPVRMAGKTSAVLAPYVYALNNTTKLALYHSTTTSNSPVSHTEVTAGFDVFFSATYYTK